ncbi:hypothetical protein [Streptomyces sp. NPDC005266]|uniref:hypothetical protein n=1 Tax=Streptomyces sp. NPDC005266 TaxID=3154877 RepID=UPI0033BC9F9D
MLVFHGEDSGRELDVRVARITPHASFAELLAAEDTSRIDPDATEAEQLANLRRIYPPEKEALGPLAIEFDHRPALAGQPMPVSPEAYVQTVQAPHGVQLLLRTRRPRSARHAAFGVRRSTLAVSRREQ